MRRWIWVAAALTLLAPLAGCAGGDDVQALPSGSFVAASGSLSPEIHLFGDTVTAETRVAVDRSRLDPDRVRVKTSFAPYEQVGETEVTRRDAGDLSELQYRIRLRCLAFECITARLGTIAQPEGGAPRVFRFEPGEVRYDDPAAKIPRLLRTVRWPPLESASRINAQDPTQVYGFPFRSTVVPLPSLTYRIAPPVLAALLLGVAALLLALPITLLARRLRRRPPPVEEPEPERSPLERAMLLVEWSQGREDPEERRAALEALAVELDALGSNTLAQDTRETAWSPAPPQAKDGRRLVAAVKEAHGPVA